MASPSTAVLIGSMRPHFARARSSVFRYVASLWTLGRRQLEVLQRWIRSAAQGLLQALSRVRAQMPVWKRQGTMVLSRATTQARSWSSLVRSRTSVLPSHARGVASSALTKTSAALQQTRKLVRTKLRMNAAPSDVIDPKLIRAMERVSDNLDELDDRSLMQLRLATVAILCRIREEVQVRSALDL